MCLQQHVVHWSFPLASADDSQGTDFHKHDKSLLMIVSHLTQLTPPAPLFSFHYFVKTFYIGQMQPEQVSECSSNIIILFLIRQYNHQQARSHSWICFRRLKLFCSVLCLYSSVWGLSPVLPWEWSSDSGAKEFLAKYQWFIFAALSGVSRPSA